MSASPLPVIDLSSWRRADDEPLGETDKRWFVDPCTSQRWLYKPNRQNRSQDEGSCEAATSRIANLLGIPAASVELARYAETTGCISRNVILDPTHEMEEAASYLVEFTKNFDPRDKQSRGHSLATIRALLEQIQGPIGYDPTLSAADWFSGYLLFDALIGNTDRHSQNWAVETTQTGELHLAPSFDHATSLGISNRGDKRDRLLESPKLIPDFAAQATAHRFESGKTVSLVDFACSFLAGCSPQAQEHWRHRINDFPAAEAIEALTSSRMSLPATSLATNIIQSNLERLRQCLSY
ncbi:HipA domain-containing protein [Arthrobacter antibioticus]|uniref:HipA domain-containing protein n=1 Tax=Arthrobacter sp. H35-MC1 TaxID=3046203 RepID=UPI0024BADB46|nr:HipA domain-containing protein [Arthrobacter sp. H35-MC1]MDJ0316035.1 HipA domain-containing protein [Arthrobacter sp. H35-MC1]